MGVGRGWESTDLPTLFFSSIGTRGWRGRVAKPLASDWKVAGSLRASTSKITFTLLQRMVNSVSSLSADVCIISEIISFSVCHTEQLLLPN